MVSTTHYKMTFSLSMRTCTNIQTHTQSYKTRTHTQTYKHNVPRIHHYQDYLIHLTKIFKQFDAQYFMQTLAQYKSYRH